MEKFCLKWNDFQTTVSQSFGKLRQEKDFFDVTLVSDDEKQIQAHKLVLSSSSKFFKNILKQVNHSNPLIYLSGITSKDLECIVDYIYHGEVQIYQEDIDSFLEHAKKLKIEGLIDNQATDNQAFEDKVDLKPQHQDEFNTNDRKHVGRKLVETKVVQRIGNIQETRSIITPKFNGDLRETINELIEKVPSGFECKCCGKTYAQSGDIRKHVEIHIEGLSYDCTQCEKSFRSRVLLTNHKQRSHRF